MERREREIVQKPLPGEVGKGLPEIRTGVYVEEENGGRGDTIGERTKFEPSLSVQYSSNALEEKEEWAAKIYERLGHPKTS